MDASQLSGPDRDGVGSANPLVERERPLALANRALRRAAVGRGSMLVLDGAAGSGKSSLLAAVRAAPGDIAVLSATGRELERDFALSVVVQLFEARLASTPEDERARLLSGPARAAFPLFARHPRDTLSDGSFSLLHGLCRLCANLAEPTGLAILVDDVELADRASLRFLLYLTERLEEVPVALVLASGAAVGSPDRDLLDQLLQHPAATHDSLGPLSARGTALQLRSEWFPGAGDDFCTAVHRATRGNPQLVRDLAGALWDMNLDPDAAGARQVHSVAPISIATSALRHAGRAGHGAPALLRMAAILGDGAEVRHAARLAGLDGDLALDLAAALMETGLLVDGDDLSFAQPVVRAAVAAAERPAERAAAHLRAARLLMDEEAPAELVAGHLLHAPGSASAWAVDILRDVAASLLARGEPGAAVGFLRRALEEPPDHDIRAEVVLELGRAEAIAGEPDAVPRLQEAMERIDDPVQRGRAALVIGRTLFALGREFDAVTTFRQALEDLEQNDDELSGQLSSALAAMPRLSLGATSLIADVSWAPPAEATTDRASLALLAMDAGLRGDPHDEVRDLALRALGDGALLEDETADGVSYYLATGALVLAEDLTTAQAALTAAVHDAQSRGSILGVATASHFRGMAFLRQGRLDEAAADARQAIAAERRGWLLAIAAARAAVAQTMMETGELEAAHKQLDLAERAASGPRAAAPELLAVRGSLHLVSGEAAAALADFLGCRDSLEAIGAINPAVAPWRSGAARTNAVLGDSDEAVRLAEEELALAEAFGAPGPVGRALRVLGAVREGAAALEALEAAVMRLESSEAWLENARALVDFGAALRRSGHRRAAREPLRRGLALAERCGASTLASRALRETLAAGARPRRTALQGLEALTTRERQVASLAARGLSNREIAETLFVTIKTVEWHLHHSFEKLQVTSRGGLQELFAAEEQ